MKKIIVQIVEGRACGVELVEFSGFMLGTGAYGVDSTVLEATVSDDMSAYLWKLAGAIYALGAFTTANEHNEILQRILDYVYEAL